MRARGVGWIVGVLSAAVSLGVGEAVAAFVRPAASPLVAVANRVIVLTPESLKRPAINAVGTNDKPLLITAIVLLLSVLAAGVGVLAMRRVVVGVIGVLAIGAFAVYCAATANGSRASDVIPALIGTVAAVLVLVLLVRVAGGGSARNAESDATRRAAPDADAKFGMAELPNRRAFVQAGVGAAAFAALAGFGGRAVQRARFNVAAARAKVSLPPVSDSSEVPAGADLGRGAVPWATPNGDFYRIDTAVTVPQIDPGSWQLRIHGMVTHPMTLSFADVLSRPMIERWITLCCVSNPVGGPLIGNALFRGIRLADLLREAGLEPNADQLLLHSYDGYTFGAPAAVVMDGRDSLLAVGMNGQPLPVEHGFPVRTVVPGLYGYVSACKWIVEIEATTFAARAAYWVDQGWAPQPPIQLAARIDTPRPSATLSAGTAVAVAGIAWDQHVGVSKVEVQVDDGPWLQARLAPVPSTDTWRQWVLMWTPDKPGIHRLQVRATDGRGGPQTPQRADPYPAGATGLHAITVRVSG